MMYVPKDAAYPLVGTCDTCHTVQCVRVSGDVRSSDGALMDRFICEPCTSAVWFAAHHPKGRA